MNSRGEEWDMPNVNVKSDDKGQLEQIEAYVIPGETLHAVFDCQGRGPAPVAGQRRVAGVIPLKGLGE
jgi:hypothetical protein